MTTSFHRLAERELNQAARYYELGSTGLGAAFLTEVERSCQAIADYPAAAESIGPGIRRRLLRRFPYAVIYSEQVRGIRVLAVMNLRRRPNYWVDRK